MTVGTIPYVEWKCQKSRYKKKQAVHTVNWVIISVTGIIAALLARSRIIRMTYPLHKS